VRRVSVFYVSLKRVVEDSPLRVGPTSFILKAKLSPTFHPLFYPEGDVSRNVPPHTIRKSKRERKEKENIMHIQDNFLAKEKFIALRDIIMALDFPWYFGSTLVHDDENNKTSPGQLVHHVYKDNIPISPLYDLLVPILKHLKATVVLRIKVNSNIRLPEPYFSDFHTDILDMEEAVTANFTTSILFMNTCNGYTEIENGEEDTRVENVANRIVSFPANIEHRGVTQTDEQRRIVINFNYF